MRDQTCTDLRCGLHLVLIQKQAMELSAQGCVGWQTGLQSRLWGLHVERWCLA